MHCLRYRSDWREFDGIPRLSRDSPVADAPFQGWRPAFLRISDMLITTFSGRPPE